MPRFDYRKIYVPQCALYICVISDRAADILKMVDNPSQLTINTRWRGGVHLEQFAPDVASKGRCTATSHVDTALPSIVKYADINGAVRKEELRTTHWTVSPLLN